MSLRKLLDIRSKRKDRVFSELQIARKNVIAREKMVKEKKAQLENYYTERTHKKKSLFDDISSRSFTKREHIKYLAKLAAIDAQEKKYTDHLKMAETLLQTAENDFQQAKLKSTEVLREIEKLTEILKGTEDSERVIALRKEEREAEDFVSTMNPTI